MTNHYPTPYTLVSNATLHPDNLLENFADALERCIKALPGNEYEGEYTKLIAEARDLIGTDEGDLKSEVIDELHDSLDGFSTPYCYFGTLEGDAACFGWWPDPYAIEDLPRVSDPSEAEGLGEDCVYVNDHGNVAVFGGDGSIIWDCV